MPTYADVADLRRCVTPAILIQMSDDAKTGQVDDAVCDSKIEEAEGLVHAALSAAGYAVPVALPIPAGAEVIKSATVWLAVCSLAARRGMVPEDYKDQCDYYRGQLDKIAAGLVALPIPGSATSNPRSSTYDQEPVFTRTKRNTSDGETRNPDQAGSLDIV